MLEGEVSVNGTSPFFIIRLQYCFVLFLSAIKELFP